MKAAFFLLLTLFFSFSVFSEEITHETSAPKAAPLKNELKMPPQQEQAKPEATGKKETASVPNEAKAQEAEAPATKSCPQKAKTEQAGTVTVERISTPGDVKYKKGIRIPNLILTADYRSPATLAEIARRDSHVMYILLPTEYSPEQKIMVYPPKIEDAFELPEAELSRFLAFVNPKRVILLGGTEVIPPKYRLAVGAKTERAEIEDLNWNINAIVLGNLLMDRSMLQKFRAEFQAAPTQEKK